MAVTFTKSVPPSASRARLGGEVAAAVNATGIVVVAFWASEVPMRFEAIRALTSLEDAAADAAIAAHDPNDPVPPEPGAPGPHTHGTDEVVGLDSTLAGLAGDIDALDTAKADAGAMTTALAAKCASNDARLSDARAPTAHVHATANVTGLDAALAGKADSGHTHAGLPTFFVLASDISTGANVTPVSVTGLVFPFVANGRYLIDVYGSLQNAAATTGVGLQLNASVAVTLVTLEFSHQLANAGTVTGGSSIANDASVGVSSGVPSTARVPFRASGTLIAGANPGTAQLRLRSETTAVATIKQHTIMRVQSV